MSTGIKILLIILLLVALVYGISYVSENSDLVLINLLSFANTFVR